MHPSCEQMCAYPLGKLPEESLEQIASHVDGCATCESVLKSLGKVSDTLVAQLHGPARAEAALEDPSLQAQLAKAKAIVLPPASQETQLPGPAYLPAGPFQPGVRQPRPRGDGYQLSEVIGRGQFGEVWLAEAPGGVPVATKLVAPN